MLPEVVSAFFRASLAVRQPVNDRDDETSVLLCGCRWQGELCHVGHWDMDTIGRRKSLIHPIAMETQHPLEIDASALKYHGQSRQKNVDKIEPYLGAVFLFANNLKHTTFKCIELFSSHD